MLVLPMDTLPRLLRDPARRASVLLLGAGLLLTCACSSASQADRPRPDAAERAAPRGPRVGDERAVKVSELSALDRRQIEQAWEQFLARSPLWRISLRGIVDRGGAGPYVLSENLFRHFFTASIYSQKAEIDRVAQSAAVIGEPAVAYFAKPLVSDLVPLGKPVVAEVPDPNDPQARIKKTFNHFQIDDFIRRDAARVLVAIGAPAVATLSSDAVLKQARPSGRRYAAFALGQIATDEAVAVLGRLLAQEADWQDRAAAAKALGVALPRNQAARPLLERALRDPDDFVRRKADEALAGRSKLPF
jgi:hypothetical protein